MTKILVVDNDPDIVESTLVVLKGSGYEAVIASNGIEGYAKAKSEKPGLILLDVMMTHDTEGFDVAQTLSKDKDTSHIPVILVTGIRKAKMLPFRFEPDEDWLPVKAVLEKPVPPERLIAEIEKALA